MFCKKGVLENFAKSNSKNLKFFVKISKNISQNLKFGKVTGLRPPTILKKEALAHAFSCEFWEIFKSTIFYRAPLVAAADDNNELMVLTNDN